MSLENHKCNLEPLVAKMLSNLESRLSLFEDKITMLELANTLIGFELLHNGHHPMHTTEVLEWMYKHPEVQLSEAVGQMEDESHFLSE